MNRTVTRWIPAVLAPVLVAGSAIAFSVSATAAVDLVDKSPSQLLQFVNTNPDIAFSGKVVKEADLGLPPMNIIPDISQSMVDEMTKTMPKEMADFIPKASAQGELALALEFLGGTHTANIYVDGTTRARLQVLDQLSERNFIRNGSDLWFYDASKAKVQHATINPADEARAEKEAKAFFDANSAKLPFDAASPAAIADYLLAQADKQTAFSVGKDVKVAGRGVYQLIMKPRTEGTLIDSVIFAIDGATGLPLGVEVKAVGKSDPAFTIEFESITFETPAASNFAFTAPAGTTVEEILPPTEGELMKYADKLPSSATTADALAQAKKEAEALEAQGWAAVVEIPADQLPAELRQLVKGNELFNELTQPVAGGRIFTTTLMNIYFADDGRVFAGLVTTERLLQVAAA